MPAPEAFAYPLLLAATYGVYRVGRTRAAARAEPDAFDWTRLAALAMLLGLALAVQVRLAESGYLSSPVALGSVVLSIAALGGLAALHLLQVGEAYGLRRAALPPSKP